ncbi:hypothetical protein [Haladaptatus sp. DJG-WS-42]|uniref:hypothetical protein n=1 Tax=Haladaptatus sp. DJG-WS-42 TaxID=3120516 RepID=UPI0030D57ED9
MTPATYTDGENTGAPLVPLVTDTMLTTDGGTDTTREYLQEMVWSHRADDA